MQYCSSPSYFNTTWVLFWKSAYKESTSTLLTTSLYQKPAIPSTLASGLHSWPVGSSWPCRSDEQLRGVNTGQSAEVMDLYRARRPPLPQFGWRFLPVKREFFIPVLHSHRRQTLFTGEVWLCKAPLGDYCCDWCCMTGGDSMKTEHTVGWSWWTTDCCIKTAEKACLRGTESVASIFGLDKRLETWVVFRWLRPFVPKSSTCTEGLFIRILFLEANQWIYVLYTVYEEHISTV